MMYESGFFWFSHKALHGLAIEGDESCPLEVFSPSKLLKNFRDAIKVTQDLIFYYLWINSLCIV